MSLLMSAFEDQMRHWAKCLETAKIFQTVPALQELRVQRWIQTRKPGLEIAIHSSVANTLPSCHGLSHHAVGSPIMSQHSHSDRRNSSCLLLHYPFPYTFYTHFPWIVFLYGSVAQEPVFQTDLSKTLLNDKQIISFALRGITISNSSFFSFLYSKSTTKIVPGKLLLLAAAFGYEARVTCAFLEIYKDIKF